jgi:hypothetical protein
MLESYIKSKGVTNCDEWVEKASESMSDTEKSELAKASLIH